MDFFTIDLSGNGLLPCSSLEHAFKKMIKKVIAKYAGSGFLILPPKYGARSWRDVVMGKPLKINDFSLLKLKNGLLTMKKFIRTEGRPLRC
ncbi:MAG: hypothetical protein PHS17_04015, partial [Desulfobacterales bacterium]|nr:hypothetical protein [Desulfobacterales bacterium]